MRLVALAPSKDGSIEAALQIEPKPGWVTYWREPGSAGIPPQITPAPGSGLVIDAIGYPTPKHVVDRQTDEIVYDAPVTLPFALSPVKKGALANAIDIRAFIGLCREICIPFEGRFKLPLMSSRSNLDEATIIEDAKAALPRAPSDDFSIVTHTLSPDRDRLDLTIALSHDDGPPPQIIVAGPSGHVFTHQLSTERKGKILSVQIGIGTLPKDYSLDGKTWTVLVIDGPRAIEAPLAFP